MSRFTDQDDSRLHCAPGQRLRVLLLDDRYLSRRGMEIVLSAHDDIEIVGAADRARSAELAGLAPDVVILDHCPQTYRRVRRVAPAARILMLGLAEEAGAELDVAPGDGPLDRRLSAEDLTTAVLRAARPAPGRHLQDTPPSL